MRAVRDTGQQRLRIQPELFSIGRVGFRPQPKFPGEEQVVEVPECVLIAGALSRLGGEERTLGW